MMDLKTLEARLRRVTFRLEWDEDGVNYQGTGFFISSRGAALTAFHNIPSEVRENPRRLLRGHYDGAELPFRWAATSEADIRWQRELQIAVLQLDTKAVRDLPTAPLSFLSRDWSRERREEFWNGRPVATFGFPVEGGPNGELILGTVQHGSPLQDLVLDGALVNDCGSVALSDEFQLPNGAASGLSGGPLCCRSDGDICGVVFAAQPEDGRMYATEFCHLAEVWPAFRELARGQTRRGWLMAAMAGSSAVAGLLMWRPWSETPIRPARDAEPAHELELRVYRYESREPVPEGAKIFRYDANWEAVRPSTPFHPNEIVRFAVRSPAEGYLYVVDRERYADGSLSRPLLIFPSATMKADNRVKEGQTLEFPASIDDPSYMRLQQSRPDHVGEVLTLLILSEPLGPGNEPISMEEFRSWSGESDAPPGVNAKVFVHPAGRRARASVTIPVRIAL